MSDANALAASGEPLSAPRQPYTLLHKLHAGGIGFIAVCRKLPDGDKSFQQRLAKLPQLISQLPSRDAEGDWYLSVNSFGKPRRRIENLVSIRASFLDLDTYTFPVWEKQSPEEVWGTLEERLTSLRITRPQLVVFSGRGLQTYWTYRTGLPVEVLPRWRAVQKHLADSLKEFAPDYGALDAARVMRLPGTINTKSGMRAHFVHLDLDEHTDFEELARAVLPIDRSALRERRQARDANAAGRPAGSRCEAMARFVDTILVDVRRLIAHRWAGRIPKLHRNETLFVYGCFLVRRTGIVALPSALLDFGTSVCDLDDGEMEQIAGSIARKIAADRVGYRFSVAGAAERLGITAQEARLAGLVRLHPADPALEAERLNAQRARDRERKRQRRLSAGARPRELSLAKSKPWARHGISRSTWFRRRKTHDLLATSDGETVSSRPTDGGTPLSVGDGLLPRDR